VNNSWKPKIQAFTHLQQNSHL